MSLLTLSEVTRVFRTRAEAIAAVDRVSLSVAGGEVVALVGPSGSGKTTLLNLIVGWERPDGGSVCFAEARNWNGMAVVPQALGLLDELTIGENIALPGRLGNAPQAAVEAVIELLGLDGLEGRMPEEVSVGEQQRTAVARACVYAQHLLVADEPTAHQDEQNALVVAGALRAAADRSVGVVVATHDERVLAQVDRVIRIADGRIEG